MKIVASLVSFAKDRRGAIEFVTAAPLFFQIQAVVIKSKPLFCGAVWLKRGKYYYRLFKN